METNLDMGSDGTNLLAEIDEPTFHLTDRFRVHCARAVRVALGSTFLTKNLQLCTPDPFQTNISQ